MTMPAGVAATSTAESPPKVAGDIIDSICDLNWAKISKQDLMNVAAAYYYFSIQFRENLEIARKLHPEDAQLEDLDRGECNTDNLSPWPGVAQAGEKMNHDEFMRRLLLLTEIPQDVRRMVDDLGQTYLRNVRQADTMARAMSIASYEDGGLEAVFTAFLSAPQWDNDLLRAFKHFLEKHIEFDSDPDAGHGALCRHLAPDERIIPLWTEFHQLLVSAAPGLARTATH